MSQTAVLDVAENTRSVRNWTRTERRLAELWRQVLETEHFRKDDDFLDLGGDSLAALGLVAHIRASFEIQFTVSTVFDTGTLARMATAIDQHVSRGDAGLALKGVVKGHTLGTLRPIVPAFDNGNAPTSITQRYVWQRHWHESDPRRLNLIAKCSLPDGFKPGILRLCLRDLQRRHEILRSRFQMHDGDLVQVLDAAARSDIAEVSCQSELDVHRVFNEYWASRFDLRRAPLIRVVVIRHRSRNLLVLVAHAMVADAASLEGLLRELTALYRSVSSCHRLAFVRPLLQYADYSAWQRIWLRSRDSNAQDVFELSPLPTGEASSCDAASRSAKVRFVCDESCADSLERVGRINGATLFMTALAALKVVLYRQTQQVDIVVGTLVPVRSRPEAQGLIGPFTNRLSVRTTVQGADDFHELVQTVRRSCLDALDQADLPTGDFYARAPWLERVMQIGVVFSDLRASEEGEPVFDSTVSVRWVPDEDLLVRIERKPHGLGICMDYNRHRFTSRCITALADDLNRVLSHVVRAPATTILEIPLASDPNAVQCEMRWADTVRTGYLGKQHTLADRGGACLAV